MQAKIYLTAAVCSLLVLGAKAQVKPNTQTQPSSTTQTLNTIPSAYAGGSTINYIRTWDAAKPFSADTSLSSGLRTVQEVKQTSQYIDGLGRPLQTVVKQVTPNGYDIVSADIYDQYAREIFQYIPYIDTSANGNFKTDPFHKQANFEKAFYNPTNDANGEKFFYSKTDYEASPAGRPLKSYPTGNSWAGRGVGVSKQYLVNNLLDSVCIWDISFTIGSVPVYNGYYTTGMLTKNVTTDERGYQQITYNDKDGHVILKKVQNTSTIYSGHTGWLCTYYIYDDLGNLRFVIQPLGVGALKTASWVFDGSTWATSTIAKQLCFNYEYDARRRMIIKRVPGAEEVLMVYDTRDRLVMTQDGNLRGINQWLYATYDSLNRPVLTGIWASDNDRTWHQGQANNGGNYPNPSSAYVELAQTYYDDYTWVAGADNGLPTSAYTGYNNNTNYFYSPSNSTYPYPMSMVSTNLTRGMITGTKIKAVTYANEVMCSVDFYDDRMRIIQTQSRNFSGGIDTAITQFSFRGQVLRTLVCHRKAGTNALSIKVLNKMTYDVVGRVIQVTQKTGNSAEVIIARNDYDELGQLKKKNLGQTRTSLTDFSYTSNPIDSLNYTYNIRGWLRGINKDYANATGAVNWFGMELNYDFGFTSSQLNGNIAGIKWRSSDDGQQRAYGFSYDAVNRLTKGDFTQNAGGSTWDLSAGIDFSLRSVKYDANGNITQLYQKGMKLNSIIEIDSLAYGYNTSSNQLKYVTDKANDNASFLGDFKEITKNTNQDYWYDDNGNLLQDKNKGISNIHYNYLNLPEIISITGKGTIQYIYNTIGVKLQKIVFDSTVTPVKVTSTLYFGLFNYQNDTLQYVATPEGRARTRTVNSCDTMFYDYMEKDHLGSTRVVLTDEKQQDIYPVATLENYTTAFNLEQSFYTINSADTISVKSIASWGATTGRPTYNNNGVPNNNPYLTSAQIADTSKVVYKLNGATGDKTGLGIALKVMAGDQVQIFAKSFWHGSGTNPNNSYLISSALTNFINSFAGTSTVAGSGKGATATALNSSPTTTSTATTWLNGVPNPTLASVPKAYVNWIMFDEQFRVISGGSNFDLVSTTSDAIKTHNQTVSIGTSGYLYVYCSNESNINVFFDNLQLIHTRGPLLETDNYYPFGLIQAGISSQAAGKLDNKYKYNGKELENNEFTDGSGLEWLDYGTRIYDAQIGRWPTLDPLLQKIPDFSPYSYVLNNPIKYIDIDGMTARPAYASADAAAWAWAWEYGTQGLSDLPHKEYGSVIYSYTNTDGQTVYSYNDASNVGATSDNNNTIAKYPTDIPTGATIVSYIHLHWANTPGNDDFSDDDSKFQVDGSKFTRPSQVREKQFYLVTFNGLLLVRREGGGGSVILTNQGPKTTSERQIFGGSTSGKWQWSKWQGYRDPNGDKKTLLPVNNKMMPSYQKPASYVNYLPLPVSSQNSQKSSDSKKSKGERRRGG